MVNTPVIMLPPHTSTITQSTPTSLIDSFHNNLVENQSSTSPTAAGTPPPPPPPTRSTTLHPQPQASLHSQQTHSSASFSSLPNSSHLGSLSVAEWAHGTTKEKAPLVPKTQDWKDVHRNIKEMDQLYDATFYSWLKAEDNVLVTAMYLHRIANEYSLDRIINAMKWLVADWRWESTSILVRHITVGWCDEEGDMRRAQLLRHLTQTWATQYTATLITTILATPPYATCPSQQRERFLRAFTGGWDFSKLSEFFMYLQSQANIDYKVKCVMLQEAARRERETLSAKLNRRRRRRYHQHEDINNPSTTPSSPAITTLGSTSQSPVIMDHQCSDTIARHHHHLHHHLHHHQHHHRHTALNFEDHTLERTSSASQTCTSSSQSDSPLTSGSLQQNQQSQTQSQQAHSRYHHHRRISSNDMADVKRQRFSSAFESETDDIDYEKDDPRQQACSNSIDCLLNSSSSNSNPTHPAASSATSSVLSTVSPLTPSPSSSSSSITKANVISRGDQPSSSTATSSTTPSNQTNLIYSESQQHQPIENGNLSSDLSRLDLGSALYGNPSASSGTATTTTSPSTSMSSNLWVRYHQRRRSSSSNTSISLNESSNSSNHHGEGNNNNNSSSTSNNSSASNNNNSSTSSKLVNHAQCSGTTSALVGSTGCIVTSSPTTATTSSAAAAIATIDTGNDMDDLDNGSNSDTNGNNHLKKINSIQSPRSLHTSFMDQ